MKRLGIIAALPGELRPLVHGWRPISQSGRDGRPVAWQGLLGTTECIAALAGMGREAAIRACRFVEGLGVLDGLISYGWAGAISCGMQGGEAYQVAEVIDAGSGQRFPVRMPPSGTPLRLVTIDHVAQAAEKRAIAQQYQAVLVDMEAAAVAQFAKEGEFPFYCWKAVSDTPSDRLPDFTPFIDMRGSLQMPALLTYLAFRPHYWRSISRMSKTSKVGAVAAARALREWMEVDADHSSR